MRLVDHSRGESQREEGKGEVERARGTHYSLSASNLTLNYYSPGAFAMRSASISSVSEGVAMFST